MWRYRLEGTEGHANQRFIVGHPRGCKEKHSSDSESIRGDLPASSPGYSLIGTDPTFDIRFVLRTCDFYALGTVGIQDIFV